MTAKRVDDFQLHSRRTGSAALLLTHSDRCHNHPHPSSSLSSWSFSISSPINPIIVCELASRLQTLAKSLTNTEEEAEVVVDTIHAAGDVTCRGTVGGR